MEDSNRNAYLSALLNQRKTTDALGNVLVNPAIEASDLSSQASLATKTSQQAQSSNQSNQDGSSLTWDKLVNGDVSKVNEWFNPFNIMFSIGEDIVDTVAGWAGNKDLVNFDAYGWWQNNIAKYDPTTFLGGSITRAVGTYINGGKDSAETSHFTTDMSSNDYAGLNQTMKGIGQFLPEVAIGVATGGASTAVKAGVLAGQASNSFVSSNASGVRTALSEGADIGQANAYGAIKGGVSSAITLGTGALGLSGKSSGLTDKMVDDATNKALLQGTNDSFKVILNGAVKKTAIKSLGDAGIAAAQTALDPFEKQFTYDTSAVEKAYGTDQARLNTLKDIGVSAGTSALMSFTIQSVSVASDVKTRGKDGYVLEYYENQMNPMRKELNKEIKQANSLSEKYGQGEMTSDQLREIASHVDKANQIAGNLDEACKKCQELLDNLPSNVKFDPGAIAVDGDGNAYRSNPLEYGANKDLKLRLDNIKSNVSDLRSQLYGFAKANSGKYASQFNSVKTDGTTQSVEPLKLANGTYKPSSETEGVFTDNGGKSYKMTVDDKSATIALANADNIPNAINSINSGIVPADNIVVSVDGKSVNVPANAIASMSNDDKTIKLLPFASKTSDTFKDLKQSDGTEILVDPAKTDSDGKVVLATVKDGNLISTKLVSQEEAKTMVASLPTDKESSSSAKLIKGFADAYKGKKFDKNEMSYLVDTLKKSVEADYQGKGDKLTLVLGNKKSDSIDKEFAALSVYSPESAKKQFDQLIDNSSFQIVSPDELNGETDYKSIPLSDALEDSEIMAIKEQAHSLIDDLANNGGSTSKLTDLTNRLEKAYDSAIENRKLGGSIYKTLHDIDELRKEIGLAKHPNAASSQRVDEIADISNVLSIFPRPRRDNLSGKVRENCYNFSKDIDKMDNLIYEFNPDLKDETKQVVDYFKGTYDPKLKVQRHLNLDETMMLDDLAKAYRKTIKDYKQGFYAGIKEDAGNLVSDAEYRSSVLAPNDMRGFFSKLKETASNFGMDISNPLLVFSIAGGGRDSDFYKQTGKVMEETDTNRQIDLAKFIIPYRKDRDATTIWKHRDDKVTFMGKTFERKYLYDLYGDTLSDNANPKLYDGGFSIEEGTDFTSKLTESNLSELNNLLTDKEKEEVKSLLFDRYNSKETTDYAGNAFEIQKGYRNIVPNYYPTEASNSALTKDLTMGSQKGQFVLNASAWNHAKSLTGNTSTGIRLRDPFARFEGYCDGLTRYANEGIATKRFNFLMNTIVTDESGNKVRLKSKLSEYIPGFDTYLTSAYKKWMGISEGLKNEKALQFFNLYTGAILISPSVPIKNFGSAGTGATMSGWGNLAKAILTPGFSSDMDYLNHDPYWQMKYSDNEYAKANSFGGKIGVFNRVLSKPAEMVDMVNNIYQFRALKNQALRDGFGTSLNSPETKAEALKRLHSLIFWTQSNNVLLAKSRLRNNEIGTIFNLAFGGVFGSDNQNKATMVVESLSNYLTAKKIKDKAFKDMNDGAKSEQFRKSAENAYKQASKTINKTPKMAASIMAAFLFSGMVAYLANEFRRKVYGQEKWGDFDATKAVSETLMNGYVSWIPVVGQITDSIQNNTDINLVSFGTINNVISYISGFNKATDQETKMNYLRKMVMESASLFGVPANNIYHIVYGITSAFDPDTALKERNLLYGASSTDSSKLYSAITNNDEKTANAYLTSIMTSRVGSISADEQKELISLMEKGESVLPSEVPTTYKDSNGNDVTISWTDKQEIKKYYAKANALATKMISTSSYRALSSSGKASAIKAVYKAYKEAAIAKTIPSYAITSKASYLAKAGLDMAFLLSAVQAIKEIEVAGSESKKTKAVAYVNKLSLTKAEKLIVLMLSGYSVSDTSTVKTYLKSKGMKDKEVKAFIGED